MIVSDASVLIDLERGDLLEACFRLPFQFNVPDLMYHNELKDYSDKDLIGLGLSVRELDEKGVSLAVKYRLQKPNLSVPDSFALSLAHGQNWTLLSGDRVLRQFAESNAVECRGLLWLLDEILAANTATMRELYDGLVNISRDSRCRLPNSEIQRRLDSYWDKLNTGPMRTNPIGDL